MKKFLAILSAVLVGLVIALPASPASAGPAPRVSVRLSVASDCTATLHASWSGFTAEPGRNMVVAVWSVYGFTSFNAIPMDTARGKGIATFKGQVMPDVYSVVGYVASGELTDEAGKTAPCDLWAAVPNPTVMAE